MIFIFRLFSFGKSGMFGREFEECGKLELKDFKSRWGRWNDGVLNCSRG